MKPADNFAGVQDIEIVALMAAGDQQGLAAAYDAYADRLHDYARSLLRSSDPAAAADVTHDTFLIAFAKAADLRDPERLRPWLYAITRNECLRVLKHTRRTEPLEIDVAERSSDMSHDLAAADLSALVHAAANGLSPKDREVFDLGIRHDLAVAEIAAALGISDNAAHAMLSRARGAMARSLGAFVVGRDRSCPDLRSVLEGWDGSFDPLWRKRIARHVDSCATCAEPAPDSYADPVTEPHHDAYAGAAGRDPHRDTDDTDAASQRGRHRPTDRLRRDRQLVCHVRPGPVRVECHIGHAGQRRERERQLPGRPRHRTRHDPRRDVQPR